MKNIQKDSSKDINRDEHLNKHRNIHPDVHQFINILSSFPYGKEFVNFLYTEKRYSLHTIHAYTTDLKLFHQFLITHMGHVITIKNILELTPKDGRAFLSHMLNTHCTSSVSRILSSIRSYAKYMKKYHDINLETLQNFKNPKTKIALPRSLDHKQIMSLFNKIKDISKHPEQDYLLLMFIYATGLRITEVLSLQIKNICANPTEFSSYYESITVVGKGNKERLIPLLDQFKPFIVQFCQYKHSDDYVFSRPNFPNKPLYPRYVQRLVEKLRYLLNLPENTTPHTLRHTFATHLLQEGADLKSIQELLGHASLASTQRYIKIDQSHLTKVVKKFHLLK